MLIRLETRKRIKDKVVFFFQIDTDKKGQVKKIRSLWGAKTYHHKGKFSKDQWKQILFIYTPRMSWNTIHTKGSSLHWLDFVVVFIFCSGEVARWEIMLLPLFKCVTPFLKRFHVDLYCRFVCGLLLGFFFLSGGSWTTSDGVQRIICDGKEWARIKSCKAKALNPVKYNRS